MHHIGRLRHSSPKHRYMHRPPPANHPAVLGSPRSGAFFAPGTVAPDSDSHSMPFVGKVRDQGQTEGCVGFGDAKNGLIHFGLQSGTPLAEEFSPLFIWDEVRIAEGTFPQNVGCSIADAITVQQNVGMCPEQDLPFDGSPSTAPTDLAVTTASQYRITGGVQVDVSDPEHVKRAINVMGSVSIGLLVYAPFESIGPAGIAAVPDPDTDQLCGGHCMCGVAYDSTGLRLMNSWGTGWGDGGFVTVPWAYVAQATECWALQPVSGF
jgi:C1A family cysteine protease